MNPQEVAQYLQDNPQFFEEYADLLADIFVPHPHGGRAISISERQMVALRDKNRLLEDKLRELIRFGEENDAIGEKMHRLSLALASAGSPAGLVHALEFNLREDFAVPHVALRIWGLASAPAMEQFEAVPEAVRALAEGLASPACGPHVPDEVRGLFGADDRQRLRSFALIALRREAAVGLLALASEDAQRFFPQMGVLYLQRLGELVSAALARHLG